VSSDAAGEGGIEKRGALTKKESRERKSRPTPMSKSDRASTDFPLALAENYEASYFPGVGFRGRGRCFPADIHRAELKKKKPGFHTGLKIPAQKKP